MLINSQIELGCGEWQSMRCLWQSEGTQTAGHIDFDTTGTKRMGKAVVGGYLRDFLTVMGANLPTICSQTTH